MQIPLIVSKDRLYTLVTVRIPNLRVMGVVKFFIDTGSPKTLIGEMDALKLRMNTQRINFNDDAYLGGTKIFIGEIKDKVQLYFKTQGASIPFTPAKFYVSKGMLKIAGVEYPSPSLLGIDFLIENKLALYFNPSENVAYLERRDDAEEASG